MEIKVIEESKNKILVEVAGEDATLCNALRKELYNDSHVKNAAYSVKHPSIGVPTIFLETDGTSPREALSEAAKRIKKNISEFKKQIEKEL